MMMTTTICAPTRRRDESGEVFVRHELPASVTVSNPRCTLYVIRILYYYYYSGVLFGIIPVYYRLAVVTILFAYAHTRRVRGNRTAHLAADQILVRGGVLIMYCQCGGEYDCTTAKSPTTLMIS